MPHFLLAESRIEAVNLAFRSQRAGNAHASVIMIAAVATAIALTGIIYLYCKRKRPPVPNDSKRLFSELCGAYTLNRHQRRLLLGLAEARGLKENPCLIFVDSQYWVMAPITNKMFCEPRIRNQLMLLQRTLFTYQHTLPDSTPP